MGIEIERRFLVDGRDSKPWRGERKSHIFQVYLRDVKMVDNHIVWGGQNLASLDSEINNIASWRIRIIGEKAILTAKGNKIGSKAEEFEWELPLEIYNNLAIDGLPLKVNQILPADVVINTNPPPVGFTLVQEIAGNRQLRCFNSTYGKLSVERIGPRAEVRFPGALPSGRARVNCTMPGPNGRWRWFGKQFLVP